MTTSHSTTARGIADAVRSGNTSAEAVVLAALGRARQTDDLGAYLSLMEDDALTRARTLDERRERGEKLGPLAGVPIAVKDAICAAGHPTTAGSKILTRDGSAKTGWRPPYDATVIERLRRADAIVMGKTNMDEFAMGSSNENSAFGVVKNPWDVTRIPGGSSGGSAVAVATQSAPLSLGSDTGGSIRQPAALTGVVGVKPSYGRVSRYGLVAFASSLDQIGPFGFDVADCARLLEVIAGRDPRDSTSSERAVGAYEDACDRGVAGLRIGVPAQYFADGLEPAVRARVEAGLETLEAAGARLVPVELPTTRHGVATYYILATAEASSNLARFDGVRFGARAGGARTLDDLYQKTRAEGFGAEVKRRILLGTYVLSAGYYDAYYEKARQVRRLIAADFARVFESVDVLAGPTSPTPAFTLGERVDDPLSMYLADVYTLPASLAGLCALSVPVGLTEANERFPSLPVGLQLLAPGFEEERLFAAAGVVQHAFPFQPPETTQT
ncbi:MAG: Asp-tRNA(Asn)/Glu-tRNA(Gln) amidotransferase subunit GatA [Polyangiaceae bacterium]